MIISNVSVLFVSLVLLCVSAVNAATPAADQQTIVVYGDSISAAYGMESDEGWVNLMATRLATSHPAYAVVNASVSGETTGGGLVRLPKTLEIHQPALVILELGGNDGLRGYPVQKIRANLANMTTAIQSSGADVLLVGMVLPPNYGRRYTAAFENLYAEVAEEFNVPFLPFLLEGVTTPGSLLQRDGIHPTKEAQQLLLDDIWPAVQSWIDSRNH